MISVCMKCNAVMGEKEPLENKALTHGICLDCIPQWFIDSGLTESEAMKEVLKMKEKHNGENRL